MSPTEIPQPKPADFFRQLHETPPLILPNAWDVTSARLIEGAGAKAIATTSAGLSWASGRPDGHGLSRRQAVDATRAIVESVDLPVSADIEAGYGDGSANDVAETTRAMLDLGVVGINLEDAPGDAGAQLRTPEQQAKRIRAARRASEAAGQDLFINARTDVYLAQVGPSDQRLDAVLQRAVAYLEAGADGIFVPGVSDLPTITALAQGVNGPLNVMVEPGSPTVNQLATAGVRRVSLGPSLALAALGRIAHSVDEVLSAGTYQQLDGSLSFHDVNQLFCHADPS